MKTKAVSNNFTNDSNNTDLLNRMTHLIAKDLSYFDLSEERIESIKRCELYQKKSNDESSFYYDPVCGYVWEYWERGHLLMRIESKDIVSFRFLFLTIVLRTDYFKQREAESFMRKAEPIFGETEEFNKQFNKYKSRWSDFSLEEMS